MAKPKKVVEKKTVNVVTPDFVVDEVKTEVDINDDLSVEEDEIEEDDIQEDTKEEPVVIITPVEELTPPTPVEDKNVRIKLRVDHKCVVGGEMYDLKKDQCYNVPSGVKKRLNKAGLLAPL